MCKEEMLIMSCNFHNSRVFLEKRMGQEVPIDSLGEEFAGYVVRVTGGNDKQGFPMKQGWFHFYCFILG